ncbi:MAG: sulfatase-like hydrolase/transferase [Bdellovibrionales bacterium]|nr:sulfatase-like hydrolase/transferase [Bdellovibrionales bacterium]
MEGTNSIPDRYKVYKKGVMAQQFKKLYQTNRESLFSRGCHCSLCSFLERSLQKPQNLFLAKARNFSPPAFARAGSWGSNKISIFGTLYIAVLMCLFLSSCIFKESRSPSFLVLVVDSLGFDSVSCYRDDVPAQQSGFNLFCHSSIRFHHAYTPSVLAQPTLASLLTGLYPYEHGVWSNGSHFLSSQFKTLPEEAIKRGYRSSFFSGGGAIWRKSGLSQGFDVFDDNIHLSVKRVYRPARENIQLFLKWLDRIGNKGSFFSILYFPDLQFSPPKRDKKIGDLPTRKHILDQALYYLVKELKRRKKWHSTYVILLGTKGQEKYQSLRQNEIPPWSLFSDNTQVSLFIKGLSKFGKKARYGNVDIPVTLVDVGWTLFDLLGSEVLQQKKTEFSSKKLFPVLSLKRYILKDRSNKGGKEKPGLSSRFRPGWNFLVKRGIALNNQNMPSVAKRYVSTDLSDRALLIESGWPLWRKRGLSRFAVKKGPYLFIYDEKPHLYNSLTDRRELHPLSSLRVHPNLQILKDSFLFYLEHIGIKPWKPPDPFFTETLRLGKKLFSLHPFQSSVEVKNQLRILMDKNPSYLNLISWRADLALRNKEWQVLKNLGKKRKNFYWQYVAGRNLNEETGENAQAACEKIFEKKQATDCHNKSLQSLYKWIQNKEESKNKKNQSRFFYFYLKEKRDQKISHLNQVTYLVWDTRFAQFQGPLLSDLFLHLPEHKKYLKIVQDVLFFN